MTPDWTSISALATAGGTLVLAIATFASVRSANRAARTAERTLEVGLRPVLFPSRLQDPPQKIRWGDDHWAELRGGRATVQAVDGVVYLAASLRNVGAGIAVLHGWRAGPETATLATLGTLGTLPQGHPDPEEFRRQGRDLYVPAGDISFWQAAFRDAGDPDAQAILESISERRRLRVDLLYSDHEGGQRAISRFAVTPPIHEDGDWLCSVVSHWTLDRPDPRH